MGYLEFVNHACFFYENIDFIFICDPWVEGTAFNDGWNLLDCSTSNKELISKLSKNKKDIYIWYSHEHSDHFSISFLKELKGIENEIKIFYQNTFDKKTLLTNAHHQFTKVSEKKIEYFIKEEDLKEFYTSMIENLLKEYEPGKPEMKPDVLSQIEKLTQEREELIMKTNNQMRMQQQQMLENVGISKDDIEKLKKNPTECMRIMHDNQTKIHQNQILLNLIKDHNENVNHITGEINGKQEILSNTQIVGILQQQDRAIKALQAECNKKDMTIRMLETKLQSKN